MSQAETFSVKLENEIAFRVEFLPPVEHSLADGDIWYCSDMSPWIAQENGEAVAEANERARQKRIEAQDRWPEATYRVVVCVRQESWHVQS